MPCLASTVGQHDQAPSGREGLVSWTSSGMGHPRSVCQYHRKMLQCGNQCGNIFVKHSHLSMENFAPLLWFSMIFLRVTNWRCSPILFKYLRIKYSTYETPKIDRSITWSAVLAPEGLRRKNQRPRRGWRVWSPPWGVDVEDVNSDGEGKRGWQGLKMIEDDWRWMIYDEVPKCRWELTCRLVEAKEYEFLVACACVSRYVHNDSLSLYNTRLTLIIDTNYNLQVNSTSH